MKLIWYLPTVRGASPEKRTVAALSPTVTTGADVVPAIGLKGAGCPVGTTGSVGPKPFAKMTTTSPGKGEFAAVTGSPDWLYASTFPCPVPSALYRAGAYR